MRCAAAFVVAAAALSASRLPTRRDAIKQLADVQYAKLHAAALLVRAVADRSFVEACRRGGGMYRGEPPVLRVAFEAADLLDPATYNDDAAAAYFMHLDRNLSRAGCLARPSNSHVAATSAAAAKFWGPIASVWPLASPLRYAWPAKEHGSFWSDGTSAGIDELAVDIGLDDAIRRRDREVLFLGPFVVVPESDELHFRALLFGSDERNFGA